MVPKITPDMRLAGVKRFKTKATLEKFLESTNSTLTSKNFSFSRWPFKKYSDNVGHPEKLYCDAGECLVSQEVSRW